MARLSRAKDLPKKEGPLIEMAREIRVDYNKNGLSEAF